MARNEKLPLHDAIEFALAGAPRLVFSLMLPLIIAVLLFAALASAGEQGTGIA